MADIALIQTLATVLLTSMQRCESPDSTGDDALEFLYMLARLEAHKPADLMQAGVTNLVEHAQLLRQTRPELRTAASRDLSPLAVYNATPNVVAGNVPADGWAEDVLMVATVRPWLTPEKRREADLAVTLAAKALATHPYHLRSAANVALARLVAEPVSGLPEVFCNMAALAQTRATPN